MSNTINTIIAFRKGENGEMITRFRVEERIRQYLNIVSKLEAIRWADMKLTYAPAPVASVEYGRRFAKVMSGTRIHTFIDLGTGDILKAATYKAPAKNGVRGNIFAADFGESVINWHGAKYLR